MPTTPLSLTLSLPLSIFEVNNTHTLRRTGEKLVNCNADNQQKCKCIN